MALSLTGADKLIKFSPHSFFHVSEQPGIVVFEPRPSPSYFEGISGDVVFAVNGRLLHHYLLPRDCPRVCFYPTDDTNAADRERFGFSDSEGYVMAVESGWYQRIIATMLYVYELADHFRLLDECAGYYVAYKTVTPVKTYQVEAIMPQLLNMNIELRFVPNLQQLAVEVSKSSLNFSLIRMRNAEG